MHDQLHDFRQKYNDLVINSLFASIDKEIRNEIKEFEKLEKGITESIPTKWTTYEELISFKSSALSLTESIWEVFDPERFDEYAETFVSRIETELSKFPELVIEQQHEDRFKKLEEDSSWIKFLKTFKNGWFNLSTLPKRTFKKGLTKSQLYWPHEVPVRGIMRQHLLTNLATNIKSLKSPVTIELMKANIQLKEWEEQWMEIGENVEAVTILPTLKKGISKEKRKLKKSLIEIADACWEGLESDLQKVGTLELSASDFSHERVQSKWAKACAAWEEYEQGWINNFNVFLEDWRSDLAVHILILKTKADLLIFDQGQAANMDEYLGEELNAIQVFIQDTLAQIDSEEEELSSVLKKQLYNAQKKLDKEVIPSLIEKLGNKNLVNGIDRLLVSTISEMEKLTQARKVPKVTTDYLAPLDSDDITTMSPHELIAFEIAPTLKAHLEKTKERLSAELQENLLIAQDLDHIISFGLNTALEELALDTSKQEVAEIAINSLKRAESRAQDVKASLQKAITASNEETKLGIGKYQESLNELTLNENVREVRLRILRAKTLQQTEEYKAQLKGTAKNWFGQAYQWLKAKWLYVTTVKDQLAKRLMAEDQELDVEVANFLIDSEKAIDALPVIYRNLYQIHPVSDLELFVGREKELTNLTKAYDNWCNNKKGAAIIVGEKWSGLTSFMNYTQQSGLFNHPCNRYKPVTSFNAEEELLSFLSQVAGSEEKMSWSELATKLNEDSRRVIIVEDLQCLYLRTIGGFSTLISLASLVHQTSGNVFWVMSSTRFAWAYLRQTISMHEAFRFEIKFVPPSKEQVEDIIKKRNRISGYKIIFKAGEADTENKKFLKLGEDDQQKFLKDRFFHDLLDFAAGNISMALMFWLLSTEKVTEDHIEISAFSKPDFSFLNKYPTPWVHGLHQLVLHDGLTLEQFALLNRLDERGASIQLLALQEDGILLCKKKFFTINPLIYRSVISLLVSKNLIRK